jgi:hypothetical protein
MGFNYGSLILDDKFTCVHFFPEMSLTVIVIINRNCKWLANILSSNCLLLAIL